jgi:molybdopterin synthase sulfur carrier subunit
MEHGKNTIDLRLFASLAVHMPPDAHRFPISAGTTVAQIVDGMRIPRSQAKLVFINGVRKELETSLKGGERVAVFPPLGGG